MGTWGGVERALEGIPVDGERREGVGLGSERGDEHAHDGLFLQRVL
jgi:hypothetical protein